MYEAKFVYFQSFSLQMYTIWFKEKGCLFLAFNCDQRLELDVEDQVRSLWKLGPVSNTCYGSYFAEECAENNIPVVVSTGEGTVQEGAYRLSELT